MHTPSLVDLIARRAIDSPNAPAYTFLTGRALTETDLTCAVLDQRSRSVAARLQAENGVGQRALLLYPPGLEFVVAFFGCLYAGVIAVPCHPPRHNRDSERLRSILSDFHTPLVLTTASMRPAIERQLANIYGEGKIRYLETDLLPLNDAVLWTNPEGSRSAVAVVQYTSGSTSQPKGVVLTHDNILYNQQMIQAAFEHTEASVVVGWLPFTHDMGLIGNLLQPAYVGCRCVLMSPTAFLQQPIRWLQAITQYRATTSGGPNFAYDLCIRATSEEEREGLDFSQWDLAFVGAEPVRPDVLRRFTETFGPYGFRSEAFYPCYGLAEATLIVTGGKKDAAPALAWLEREGLKENRVVELAEENATAQTLVGCGTSLLDQRVLIVDPATHAPCPEDTIGEIWVSGRGVANGYWNRPEATEAGFNAFLAGGREGPFLRTGDLGFLKSGEIYITGRLKDLLIIRGQNHYPQDIELTIVQNHPALRPDGCAVFSIEAKNEEQLVVIAEVVDGHLSNDSALKAAIAATVSERHELRVHAVELLKPYSLPKTTSGKIRRQTCKQLFLSKTIDTIGSSPAVKMWG